jgi:hypothetical protein
MTVKSERDREAKMRRSKEYLKPTNVYLSHIETYTTNKKIGHVQQRTSDQCSRYCTGEIDNLHH